MSIKNIFLKQGGFKLIKQYVRSGCLCTAVGEFILLGKSRTALEILRLSTQLKTKQKLEKKYRKVLEAIEKCYDNSLPHNKSNIVWICWFQGMENAPDIVKSCYESIKQNLNDKEVVLITSENMYNYIQFPDYIQRKIDLGIIKGAHLSDLLRLELLLKYGGTWIDSTVYCSGGVIPDYMLNSDLFLFQCMKPGRDGHCITISNWFITSCSNNKILYLVRELLYYYWKNNNAVIEYFIFHEFFQMCIEHCPDEWNRVIPVSNSTPHIVLLRLFDKFDDDIWKSVTTMMPFHKLTYKFNERESNKKDTYYDYIMNKCD